MGFPLVLMPGTVLSKLWPSKGHTEATLIDKYIRAAADMISNSNVHLPNTYYSRALCGALCMFNLSFNLYNKMFVVNPIV